MQPSSVIFLVVIAIWAAYLVQHWVGRREHLATARTVDRFSESMRILDRGTGKPEVAATESVGASSARLHRSRLTVSRDGADADPADFTRGAGRRLTERVVSTARGAASPENRVAATQSARQVGERARELGSRTVTSVSGATARATAKSRTSSNSSKAPLFGRSTRGVLVVGAAIALVVSALLASLGAVGGRWPVIFAGAVGCALWWLRRSVAAASAAPAAGRRTRPAPGQRSAPATSGTATSSTAASRGTRPGASGRARASGPARRSGAAAQDAASEPVSRPAVTHEGRATRGAASLPGADTAYGKRGVYDVDALTAAPPAPVLAEEASGGWSPVPVPPPTYTLKARASYPSDMVDDAEDDVVSPYATVTDVADYAAQRARLASG